MDIPLSLANLRIYTTPVDSNRAFGWHYGIRAKPERFAQLELHFLLRIILRLLIIQPSRAPFFTHPIGGGLDVQEQVPQSIFH